MIEINDLREFVNTIANPKIVIVDFYADWCGPCQQMMKIFPRLEHALGDKAVLAKVNVDTSRNLAEMNLVKKIPTFIFFREERELLRFDGIKSFKEIEQIVDSLIDNNQ